MTEAEQAFEAWIDECPSEREAHDEPPFLAGYSAAQKPIPVTTRRPAYGESVLCFMPGFRAGCGWLIQCPEDDESFTHWLPLPADPA